jgi:hypothetical protein
MKKKVQARDKAFDVDEIVSKYIAEDRDHDRREYNN